MRERAAGRRESHDDLLAGPRGRARAGRDPLPRRRIGEAAGEPRARERRRVRRPSRGGGRGRFAPGHEHPGPDRHRSLGARGGSRAVAPRRVDRRRHGRALLRAPPRGHPQRAPPYAPAADRQDGEAPSGRSRGGDNQGGRLRDGGARRSWHRAAHRAGADRAEETAQARGLAGEARDNGDPDARLDGGLLAPHASRGRRRRQRDSRRDRRGHALPGDGDRRLPGPSRRDDGRHRRRDGGDRTV